MKHIWIVFSKESLDNFRDHRSWLTGLFWAIFGPLMLGGMILVLGNLVREQLQETMLLPVSGAEYAPNLISFLEQQNVIVEPAPEDPRAAVAAGDINVALVISPEYAENFSAGKPARLQLVMDSSRQSAMFEVARIETLLKGYSEYIGRFRLMMRGVNPDVIQVIQVQEVDTATPQSQALFVLSMLPYFIIFAVFNGAAPAITDFTAGERERGSLEPLLINPVPRRWIVVGKMLSAVPFAVLNLIVTLAGFAAILSILPIERILHISIRFDISSLFFTFLICLPIVLFACALQTLIAAFTKTTKEAGTYLPFISLIPALPGLALVFLPIKPELWTMLIPTFGQQILIFQVLRAEPVVMMNVLISAAVTLALTVLLTLIAIVFYNNERVVIGK